jgi:hypothetical protein
MDPWSHISDEDVWSHIWVTVDAGDLVASCAWCGRVRIDDIWLVPSPAALAAIDTRNTFSHSICDECSQTASMPRPPAT